MTPEQIETVTQFPTWLDTNRYCDLKREAAALRALLAEWESGETMLANLRTEAGKAAFAAANGWPMPEELDAAKRLAEERGREVERLKAELAERSSFAREADRCWHAETMAKLKAEARLADVIALHSKRTSADCCKVCLELAPCPTLLAAQG